MEDLGFSERGQAWRDILDGRFDLDGDLPVNPDGGLKSFGHPVGASGLRMFFELWLQFRGRGRRTASSPTRSWASRTTWADCRASSSPSSRSSAGSSTSDRAGARGAPSVPVRAVTVVGSGLMGSGIAQVSAQAGYDVTVVDTADQALQGPGTDRGQPRPVRAVGKADRGGGVGRPGAAVLHDRSGAGRPRCRPGHRGDRGRPRAEGVAVRAAGPVVPARRRPGHQHLAVPHRSGGRADPAAGPCHRHALVEPAAAHDAGRAHRCSAHLGLDAGGHAALSRRKSGASTSSVARTCPASSPIG